MAISSDDLARYVGARIRELRSGSNGRDKSYDALAIELGIAKPQVHSLATNKNKGYGPVVEQAAARKWFGGSIDALHAAAAEWLRDHPEERSSGRVPALESVLTERPLPPTVVLQARTAAEKISGAPATKAWRRYVEGLQREYEMLKDSIPLPADLTPANQIEPPSEQQRARSVVAIRKK